MTMYLDVLQGLYDSVDLTVPTLDGAPPPIMLTARSTRGILMDDAQTAAMRTALADRGAILIRTRQPIDSAGAASIADHLFPDEPSFDTGEHPQIEGTGALYRPVPFAPDQTLLWHHENSFNAIFPRVLIFFCRIPAEIGGATTLVDSRLVYANMPAGDVATLASVGIRYRRLCDGYAGRSWQQLYGTDEPEKARARAADNEEAITIDNDRAQISALRPAFLSTPRGLTWFNQLLHWHPAALPADLRQLVRRGRIAAFRSCETGNGKPIDDELVDRLIAVHREYEFPVAWQAGDILLVDNTVFSHGRAPYRGHREHFVRMVGRQRHDAAKATIPAN